MTRRDYIGIAAVLRIAVESVRAYPLAQPPIYRLVEDMALMLHADNPRFDRDRFYDACGLTHSLMRSA